MWDRDRTPSDRTPGRLNAVETERRGDRTPSDRTQSDRTPSETECQVRLNAKQTECQGDMNAKYTYFMLWNMFWYSSVYMTFFGPLHIVLSRYCSSLYCKVLYAVGGSYTGMALLIRALPHYKLNSVSFWGVQGQTM